MLPRLPSRRDIAHWWRNYGRNLHSFVLPRFPSRQEIASWWRNYARNLHWSVLPRFPSRQEIASWWRNHARGLPWSVLPRFPSFRDIEETWRQHRHTDLLPPLPKLPVQDVIKQLRHSPAGSVLPRLPSPRDFPEWIREKPERRKWVVLWALAAIALVAFGIGGPPAGRAIKGWQARRQADQALVFIEQQQWTEAVNRIQSAFQLRPTESAVWLAYARLLSRTGQGGLALEWWQKIVPLQTLSLEDQRDYAAAALSASELTIASEQIGLLLSQPTGPTPRDWLLAGQLSTLRGYRSSARAYADLILADTRSSSRDKLGANLLVLSNNTPEMPAYKEASQRLLAIARDETDRASPQALAVLAQQRTSARLTKGTSESLAIPLPDIGTSAISLQELADRLDRNPNSRPFHRMLALELRARSEPGREETLITKAATSYGLGDDETLMALGSWIYSHGHYDTMLQLLPLERAVQRRELLLERIDALAALGRLSEVKEMLLAEYPVLEPTFQHMYLAVVSAKLGEKNAGVNEWYRGLNSANSPRTLIGLADYAEKMGAFEIADAAYERLIKKQPGLKSGYLSRFHLAQARGQTAYARDLALEIIKLWPEDDPTRVREIYLRLLLTSDKSAARAAEEEAAPLLARNPWDGGARSALALARLKQGKTAAALTTLTEFTPGVPSSAISASAYAAALAANGWKDKAREEAQKLGTENVLPEERALIAPLLSTGKNSGH